MRERDGGWSVRERERDGGWSMREKMEKVEDEGEGWRMEYEGEDGKGGG